MRYTYKIFGVVYHFMSLVISFNEARSLTIKKRLVKIRFRALYQICCIVIAYKIMY